MRIRTTEGRRDRPPARKRFGQHFLEPAWAARVAEAIAPGPGDTFLEIGPGRGVLTRLIAPAARAIVAVEIDRDLARTLQKEAPRNVRVVEGDFLRTTADQLQQAFSDQPMSSPIRVAGNLPYNVASPILFKLIELYRAGLPLSDATLMLQREVAIRLLADPGSRDYGVLTVLIRRHAQVRPMLKLPGGAFRPMPKVQSSLVGLRFHPPDPPVRDENRFAQLTQAIFTRRRKTLANALGAYPLQTGHSAATVLGDADLDARRRPETLSLLELARLSDLVG
jgi:16S rRNA (adenine1518-N6/adenine1519-N6)-dimethyltransferase